MNDEKLIEMLIEAFNSEEIVAAVMCGKSVDSAIQDYLDEVMK